MFENSRNEKEYLDYIDKYILSLKDELSSLQTPMAPGMSVRQKREQQQRLLEWIEEQHQRVMLQRKEEQLLQQQQWMLLQQQQAEQIQQYQWIMLQQQQQREMFQQQQQLGIVIRRMQMGQVQPLQSQHGIVEPQSPVDLGYLASSQQVSQVSSTTEEGPSAGPPQCLQSPGQYRNHSPGQPRSVPFPVTRSILPVSSPSGGISSYTNTACGGTPAGIADTVYMDKVKQLGKYIEPLRRMINIKENGERTDDQLLKMKNLLEVLSKPEEQRMTMAILELCEVALKMNFPNVDTGPAEWSQRSRQWP